MTAPKMLDGAKTADELISTLIDQWYFHSNIHVKAKLLRFARELLSTSNSAAKSCQTGWGDICHMAEHDGVVCPNDSCDIDDGVRAAPAQSGEAAKWVAKVRVTHKGYSMELSKYIAYALPEGVHELYAASQPAEKEQPAAAEQCGCQISHAEFNPDGELKRVTIHYGDSRVAYVVLPQSCDALTRELLDTLQTTVKYFTQTPSTLADSQARGKAHEVIAKAYAQIGYGGGPTAAQAESCFRCGHAVHAGSCVNIAPALPDDSCPRCKLLLTRDCNCDAAYAARAAAQTDRALTDWQPIETAPKTGKWLMLFARYPIATASTPHFGYFCPINEKWYESGYLGTTEIIPSHWMPRPEFPTVAQPASGGDQCAN
ncbi:hypothetical protein PQQ75_25395 [Paraburkholderia aspalathi]|uniref:hypothetical protein n=1 Tax=Paraburkholderia aspalathi TaxID=1324617 RepID=UPI0038BCEFC6